MILTIETTANLTTEQKEGLIAYLLKLPEIKSVTLAEETYIAGIKNASITVSGYWEPPRADMRSLYQIDDGGERFWVIAGSAPEAIGYLCLEFSTDVEDLSIHRIRRMLPNETLTIIGDWPERRAVEKTADYWLGARPFDGVLCSTVF